MSSTDTGHGATITFGTSALTYAWRKITAVEQAGEAVEDTVLSEKYFRSFLPGDVYEPGEFEIEYSWGSKTALPALGTVETITLTLPINPNDSTAGDLEGDGFIMSRTAFPELTTNGLQQGKMKIAFAGTAGAAPTWTKAT